MSEAGAWWNAMASSSEGLAQLETWLGGVDHPSRRALREQIAEGGYRSVLDVGAGLGLDAIGLANINHEVSYTGVEPSATMRARAEQTMEAYEREPVNLVDAAIDSLPFADGKFDLVYCRHVLEHLPRFEPALSEMIRCARLEAAAVFFIRPGATSFGRRDSSGLYHVRWAKAEIEAALAREPRVEAVFWEFVDDVPDVILHCYLTVDFEFGPEEVAERLGAAQR